MRLSTGGEDRRARIELIPLMDIMFTVLLFFIYSVFSMSVHRGLKVDLPSAKGTLHRGERTIITVAADNTLYLNKQPMTIQSVTIRVLLCLQCLCIRKSNVRARAGLHITS